MEMKINPYDKVPDESTGALIIELDKNSEHSTPWIFGIAEFSDKYGWDKPPKKGQVWIKEDDLIDLFVI